MSNKKQTTRFFFVEKRKNRKRKFNISLQRFKKL